MGFCAYWCLMGSFSGSSAFFERFDVENIRNPSQPRHQVDAMRFAAKLGPGFG